MTTIVIVLVFLAIPGLPLYLYVAARTPPGGPCPNSGRCETAPICRRCRMDRTLASVLAGYSKARGGAKLPSDGGVRQPRLLSNGPPTAAASAAPQAVATAPRSCPSMSRTRAATPTRRRPRPGRP